MTLNAHSIGSDEVRNDGSPLTTRGADDGDERCGSAGGEHVEVVLVRAGSEVREVRRGLRRKREERELLEVKKRPWERWRRRARGPSA